MLLATSQLQLCAIIPSSVSRLLDFQDLIVPHGRDAFVEGPLDETSNPEELSAIHGELALGLMGLPMVTLAVHVTIVGRRLDCVALLVGVGGTTTAAIHRRSVATVRAHVGCWDQRNIYYWCSLGRIGCYRRVGIVGRG